MGAKKRKKYQHCSLWQQKKEKRESPTIFAHDRKKEKVPTFLVVTTTNMKTFEWKFWLITMNMGKETTNNFFYSKQHIQEEERKSLKSWSPSPLEWSSSCPHLPSIWLPSSSNNAKTFVYGLSHNDIVIFRVYPDPPPPPCHNVIFQLPRPPWS